MISITSQTAAALRSHACKAIHKSYCEAEDAIDRKKIAPSQKEAWHVAQLCASIRTMARDWRAQLTAELPNLTLSMSTVFTHQKPYVQWPKIGKGNPRCELADLLVAVIDRRTSHPTGSALLVQAKLSTNETVTLTGKGEKHQFTLLSRRPVFDVCKAHSPSQVDLQGNSPDSALIYGLASHHGHLAWPCFGWCGHQTWITADSLGKLPTTPPHIVTASEALSAVLVGLLQGNFGWSFDLPPHGKDWTHFEAPTRSNWSMLINYLLEDTFKGSMSKKLQSPAAQTRRGKEDQLYFAGKPPRNASTFLMTDGFNHLHDITSSTTEEPGGIEWSLDGLQGGNFGGDGEIVFSGAREEPEDGPISAFIIEIAAMD